VTVLSVHAACAGDAAIIVNPTVSAAPLSKRVREDTKFIPIYSPFSCAPSARRLKTRKHRVGTLVP